MYFKNKEKKNKPQKKPIMGTILEADGHPRVVRAHEKAFDRVYYHKALKVNKNLNSKVFSPKAKYISKNKVEKKAVGLQISSLV